MDTPLFAKILQIFIVVDDIDRYTQTYQDAYGIGPWTFHDFSDVAVPRKLLAGLPVAYQMKLAICDALNVNLALIQPLDELSIFAKHLREKGPGLHHLLVASEHGYDNVLRTLLARGNDVVQSGTSASGIEYSHVDTTRDLGTIVELFKLPQQ